MSKLLSAITTNNSLTANGAVTNSTTDNAVLDLFFIAGASRTMSEQSIINMWIKAYHTNKDLSLRLLQWARDCRGGAGERRFFRLIYGWLKNNDVDAATQIMYKIPLIGRWDDLWSSTLNEGEKAFIKNNLSNGLLCKWIPRRSSVFHELASYCRMSLSVFRRTIVKNSKTVEQLMSKNEWSEITYKSVPSKAMANYGSAFAKHDHTRFDSYLKAVQNGEQKINANLFPYEILQAYQRGRGNVLVDELWKNQPNYQTKGDVLVVADVSGSMRGLPMDVSISLAIYCSERSDGLFKDNFITFTEQPQLQQLKGNFSQKVRQLENAAWGRNTNLQAVFDLVLGAAITHRVPAEEMPSTIMIISDVEFDIACEDNNQSNFAVVKAKYANAGYQLPKLVFWNVNGRENNCPIKQHETGTVLVSGCSPSILKSVFDGSTPYEVMVNTLMVERYAV